MTLAEAERAPIQPVVELCGGNRSGTARALGIASSTLCEKIRKYRLDD